MAQTGGGSGLGRRDPGRDLHRQGRRRGPLPAAGTVVKGRRRRGRHDLASAPCSLEIAPGENGAPQARRARRPPPAEPEAGGNRRHAMPAMGESVIRGHDPRVGQAARRQPSTRDETLVEISTDKVDAEVPGAGHRDDREILAQAGDTVTVGQVIARMTTGNGAGTGGEGARADLGGFRPTPARLPRAYAAPGTATASSPE